MENKIPKITRGNAFAVRVRVARAVMENGKVVLESINLEESKDIKVFVSWTAIRRHAMDFTIKDGRLLLSFDGSTPSGLYSLEVMGKDSDDQPWRFFLRYGEFLEVVESTAEATGLNASSVYDINAIVTPSTVSKELMDRINAAVDNANNAAQMARQSVNGVSFVDDADPSATAPSTEGQLLMHDGLLYEAVTEDGKLVWQETTPLKGRIYVDGSTAQSYVVGRDGTLVRLDKETADIEYDVIDN